MENLNNKLFKRAKSAVSSVIDDEVYVLNLKTNKYLKLNKTASAVWRILEKETSFFSLQEECKKLFSKFDDSELSEFLKEAEKKEIINVYEA